MRPIINHFTDDDLYKFTMCCAVIDNYPRAYVKYSFTDRNNTVYPKGFAGKLSEQIMLLEKLKITDEEIEFMKKQCNYIPHWFYTYLKGYRYKHEWVKIHQDDEGHLSVDIEGLWSDVILLEVKILAIISELYYILNDKTQWFDYNDYYSKSYAKAERLLNAGCAFADFGTRRRASFEAEDTIVKAMKNCDLQHKDMGEFIGTSNIYLAMKYNLKPIGTMGHEFISGIGGMYGPQMANHLAMEAWSKTFRGALGTYLYDTFGWNIFNLNFSEDFARMFKGLRIDSGNNYEQLSKIIAKYESFGIDPKTKQVIFSNGLNTEEVIEIQNKAVNCCKPSFGIGTHFTNDFEAVKPLNIVIKLTAIKITENWTFYNDTCKISEDKEKYSGKPDVVQRFLQTLNII